MYKDATYKEKFTLLNDWLGIIVDSIKKDLKNEHLKKDFNFAKRFLNSKNINKITNEELTEAYQRAIAEEERGEELAEFMTARWLLKNTEIYDFFETQLSLINPDFSDLEQLTIEQATPLMESSVQHFGAPQTYIFSVLNSVVFPKEVYQRLAGQAKDQNLQHQEEAQRKEEKQTFESLKQSHERDVARLTDKYEKKLSGLQKKYQTDTDTLKKQVSQLQRKLHEVKQ
ncbi:MAG: hypothetical protein LW832_07950 [Parachlamydia sp.]|nr:hypothetical protein [Parachlamydia sp.]